MGLVLFAYKYKYMYWLICLCYVCVCAIFIYLFIYLSEWVVNDKYTAKVVALHGFKLKNTVCFIHCVNIRYNCSPTVRFIALLRTLMACMYICVIVHTWYNYSWFINGQTHKHVAAFLAIWWLLLYLMAMRNYGYDYVLIDWWGVNYLYIFNEGKKTLINKIWNNLI